MKKTLQDNNTYEQIVKQTTVTKRETYHIKKTYPAFLLLVVLLLISYFIWTFSKLSIDNYNKSEFDKAITSIMTRLETQQTRNLEILHSMDGLYDVLIQVVKDYFELYASIPVESYPSIVYINVCSNCSR
jgi:sensor domain CHASE-containing protein